MDTAAANTHALALFMPAVREWFTSAFPAPTPIQEQAWSSIEEGQNTLVIAPTGSGKTLAAFLSAINALATEKADANTPARKGVRILYISPLKALGADVERNLQAPLAAIAQRQQRAGANSVSQITVGIRTGDTPQPERARLARTPPDILITTPESLYLMLTSRARDTLATVSTVIVDELHSLAGTKRGAHCSLSLERLDSLLPEPAQRIGLSATIKPVGTAAAFLGGAHPAHVVQDDSPPTFSLKVDVPVEDMTRIQPYQGSSLPSGAPDTRTGSATIWPYIEASVLDQVLAHRSTIVFVNSRGICERLTAQLNAAYDRRCGRAPSVPQGTSSGDAIRSEIGSTTLLAGESADPIAKAHHGSVSKDLRQEIERDLKTGKLRCVVATSSLELGIDMGEVDLVIQVAAPLSVSSGLQRIGRANHQVHGKSAGIIYPRTRHEVLDAAFAVEGMLAGSLEETALIEDALDVLAQHTAAEVAMHPAGLKPKDWLATVRKSACYQHLPEAAFQAVLDMLACSFSTGEASGVPPRLDFDRAADLLRPLPRTQKLAIGSAGTIPDRGLYPVMLNTGTQQNGRKRVGELDEEMVHESRVGDVIILGTSTWRITQITNDRVLVAPAPGRTARLPFWHGEGIGRSLDAGIRRGKLQARLAEHTETNGTFTETVDAELTANGLNANSIKNLGALMAAQRASTHAIPTDALIVLETCPDDTGAWYLVVHSPFGKRVNEPWALAISCRIRETFGYDPECAALDEGIVMRISSEEEHAVTPDMLSFAPDDLASLVSSTVTETSLFAARFRECSARALLMRPSTPGKRTPLWQQRVRGGQLLEAARTMPDFPIYLEAARECLNDVYDLHGACWLMEQLEAGTVRMASVQTSHPSPFASPMLFGYVAEHLYEGDLPHAERNHALLSVDSGLLSELLGMPDQLALLDSRAIAQVQLEAQRLLPDRKLSGAEGAAELLRQMGPLAAPEVDERLTTGADADALLHELEAQHRACPVNIGGRTLWATPEDAVILHSVLGANIPGWTDAWADAALERSLEAAGSTVAAKMLRTNALLDTSTLAAHLGCGDALARALLEHLTSLGTAASLTVSAEAQALLTEADALIQAAAPHALHLPTNGAVWAAKDMLRRLRLRSRDAYEADVQPVHGAALQQLVLAQQHVGGSSEDAALDDLAECIALFEGRRFTASLWEHVIFPARVPGFRAALLDELLESGEIIWTAASEQERTSEAAFYPSDSLFAPHLLSAGTEPLPNATSVPTEGAAFTHPLTAEVCALLMKEGPVTFTTLVRLLQEASAEEAISTQAAIRALEEAAAKGLATSTSFAALRHQGSSSARKPAPAANQRRVTSRRSGRARTTAAARAAARTAMATGQRELESLAGLWSLIAPTEASPTEQAIAQVESLLDLYGIICPKTIDAAGCKGGMQAIYAVLRGMEDAGEVIRGEFVEGLGASQFARRHTVEALREPSAGNNDSMMALSAMDPAMLYGSVFPWPEPEAQHVPANRAGCIVVLNEGAPVLFATKRLQHLIAFTQREDMLTAAVKALVSFIEEALKTKRLDAKEKLIVQKLNGQDIYGTRLQDILAAESFIRDTHGMRLYRSPF